MSHCSEWFDFFDGQRLVNMSDTQLYKEDWIGLRRLDEAGRIVRDQVGINITCSIHWQTSRAASLGATSGGLGRAAQVDQSGRMMHGQVSAS